MEGRRNKAVVALLLLCGILGGGYALLGSGAGETEEDRVRKVLDECEAAFEEADVGAIARHLHPEYSDSYQNKRDSVENYLKAMLVLGKKRYVVDRREETIRVEGESAFAEFIAKGSERRGDEVVPSGLGTYEARVELRKVEGEWAVYRVDLKQKR